MQLLFYVSVVREPASQRPRLSKRAVRYDFEKSLDDKHGSGRGKHHQRDGNRGGLAILAARTAFRLCSAAVAVLAILGGNARLLHSANPNRKGQAAEKVVDLMGSNQSLR